MRKPGDVLSGFYCLNGIHPNTTATMINLSLKQSIELFLKQPSPQQVTDFLNLTYPNEPVTPNEFEEYLNRNGLLFSIDPTDSSDVSAYVIRYPIEAHGFSLDLRVGYNSHSHNWYTYPWGPHKRITETVKAILSKLTDEIDQAYTEALMITLNSVSYMKGILTDIYGEECPVSIEGLVDCNERLNK